MKSTLKKTVAPNLYGRQEFPAGSLAPDGLRSDGWFARARLGLFVHYGLYSLHGKGEWHMDYERIPPAEYNRLSERFRAGHFDARKLVESARDAGAGYVVMGARHHEGFCLFDTATTRFNSLHAPAGRDLIGEYVDACREAGLRVGIYYSIVSWQWPAAYLGPREDPQGWAAMVEETHEQLRELMTRYGRIDLLWYDGCTLPGVSDRATISRAWRTEELNAMVRSHQPQILINDRSARLEDFSTPEQHLTLPPRGRRWEMCMTINDHWGYVEGDHACKAPAEIIERLVFCARYDGNLLLNVGPRGDGTIPEDQLERLRALGEWMTIKGEAVRDTRRTPYTEGEHLLGIVTTRQSHAYFHVLEWPGPQARIAGLTTPIRSARLMGRERELAVETFADGTATLRGLPPTAPAGEIIPVIAVEFEGEPPREEPPLLLMEADTGLFDPAEAPVHSFALQGSRTAHEWEVEITSEGAYRLEASAVANGLSTLEFLLDGSPVHTSEGLRCIDYPDTLTLPFLSLTRGRHRLAIRSRRGVPFTLLAWRLQPLWEFLAAPRWELIGPFPSPFRMPGTDAEVREAMERVYPPEREYAPAATYPGAGGKPVRWGAGKEGSHLLDFSRSGNGESGVCFARTVVSSASERIAEIRLGTDWWANLFVNGQPVTGGRAGEAHAQDGAAFCGWKPAPALIPLCKGENVILVKNHQGRAGNWFNFYLHMEGDIS